MLQKKCRNFRFYIFNYLLPDYITVLRSRYFWETGKLGILCQNKKVIYYKFITIIFSIYLTLIFRFCYFRLNWSLFLRLLLSEFQKRPREKFHMHSSSSRKELSKVLNINNLLINMLAKSSQNLPSRKVFFRYI